METLKSGDFLAFKIKLDFGMSWVLTFLGFSIVIVNLARNLKKKNNPHFKI